MTVTQITFIYAERLQVTPTLPMEITDIVNFMRRQTRTIEISSRPRIWLCAFLHTNGSSSLRLNENTGQKRLAGRPGLEPG
jgi:hypothetical protein